MVRTPSLELRVRVRRDSGMLRWLGSSGVRSLRLRKDPMQRGRPAWQWVVDIDETWPALIEVLAACNGFLVDDDGWPRRRYRKTSLPSRPIVLRHATGGHGRP